MNLSRYKITLSFLGKSLLLSLILLPQISFARVEIFQIVAFKWQDEKLNFVGLGSGTAIDSKTILTNKHVVTHNNEPADFLLLCQAKERSTKAVECNQPASIIALHDTFDAAMIRPLSASIYLPSVKLTSIQSSLGDKIRIEGFPIPLDESGHNFQNFGSKKTYNAVKEWTEKGGGLAIQGDALTITRGKITATGRLEQTGGRYFVTNAKVNFGNSGGATFDHFGNFIGIPTLKDSKNNALVLDFNQLRNWVIENKNQKPHISEEIIGFYESKIGKSITSRFKKGRTTTSRFQKKSYRPMQSKYRSPRKSKYAGKSRYRGTTQTRSYWSRYKKIRRTQR